MKKLNLEILENIYGGNLFRDIGWCIGYVWYYGTKDYNPGTDTSKYTQP